MPSRFQLVLTSTIVISGSDAFGAQPPASIGLSNIGAALIIFSMATILLLTLVLRPSFGYLLHVVKHKIGAWRVRKVLASCSEDLLDDILLPGAFGGFTRIDHAVLTTGGVLCIQTEHSRGIVFGSKDEPQWTNLDGNKRRKFLNPLIRNEGRTRALQKIIPDVPVASVVVFTGNIQFTSPREDNVIHLSELNSYIAKFTFGPCRIDDRETLWLTVRSATLGDATSREKRTGQFKFS